MTNQVQWTVVIAVAALAALLLISLGGLVGWGLASLAGYIFFTVFMEVSKRRAKARETERTTG